MSAAWDDDQVRTLHRLYNSPMSTAGIARECTLLFREPVSKNAIVGKVHRLKEANPPGSGWEPRPSPIRRGVLTDGSPSAAPARAPLPASTLPPLPSSLLPTTRLFVDRPPPRLSQPTAPPPEPPAEPFSLQVEPERRKIRCLAESAEPRTRRRDGTGCLFPIGDTRSQQFCYCDGDLYNLSKPYCATHAEKSYTKESLRTRERDQAEQQAESD